VGFALRINLTNSKRDTYIRVAFFVSFVDKFSVSGIIGKELFKTKYEIKGEEFNEKD